MRFAIEPYEGALPIRFGASETDVVQLLGEPDTRSTNFRGDRSFDYYPITVGFGKKDRKVMHIAFSPGVEVLFRGRNVFEPGAFEELCRLNGAPMEGLGFVVLLNLGISLSGFHDTDDEAEKVVIVFARGEYDQVKHHMKPFHVG